MAKLTMEHQEEVHTFPVDTILDLKVEDAVTEEVPGYNGRPGWTKLKLTFKILGIQAMGDHSDPSQYENWITRQIWGSCSLKLTDHPENKLRIWTEAILGVENLGVGFELDTDMFIGRRVRGLTSQYEAKGRDSQGRPLKRHQIETLLPATGTPNVSAGASGGYASPTPAADPWASSAPSGPATDPWGAAPVADPWASAGVSSDEPPF